MRGRNVVGLVQEPSSEYQLSLVEEPRSLPFPDCPDVPVLADSRAAERPVGVDLPDIARAHD